MAISFITDTPITQTVQAQTGTCTPGNVAGNLLVIAIATRSAISQPSVTNVSDTGGNVWVKAGTPRQQSTSLEVDVWVSVTTAISGTLTVTTDKATNTIVADVLEFNSTIGWKASPTDIALYNSGTASTALTSGTSAATAQASEIAVGFGAQHGSVTFSAQTAGYTPLTTRVSTPAAANETIQASYQVLSATGTQLYACTSNTSAIWGDGVFTFMEAPQVAFALPTKAPRKKGPVVYGRRFPFRRFTIAQWPTVASQVLVINVGDTVGPPSEAVKQNVTHQVVDSASTIPSVIGTEWGASETAPSATLILPAHTVTAGNLMVVAIVGKAATEPANLVPTDSLGNTWQFASSSSASATTRVQTYTAHVTVGGSTVITITPDITCGMAASARELAISSGDSTGINSGSGTSASVTMSTPDTTSGDLLYSFTATDVGTQAYSAQAFVPSATPIIGTTWNTTGTQPCSIQVVLGVAGSPSTPSYSATLGTSTTWDAGIFSYTPKSGPIDTTSQGIVHLVLDSVATLADVITRNMVLTRNVADTVGSVVETVVKNVGHQIADAASSVSESIVRSISHVVSDTLTLTTTIAKNVVRGVADTVGPVVDTVIKNPAHMIAETVGPPSEAIVRQIVHFTTNSILLTEVATKNVLHLVADTVGAIADAVTTVIAKNFIVAVSDTIGPVADSVLRNITHAVTDTVALTETLTKNLVHFVSDSLSALVDTVTKGVVHPIVEVVSPVSEVITRSIVHAVTVVMALTDVATKTLVRGVSDALSLTETTTKAVAHAVVDSVASVSEVISRAIVHSVAVVLTTSDVVVKAVSRLVADAVSLADSLTRAIVHLPAEVLSLTDVAIKAIVRGIAEATTVTETLTRRIAHFVLESLPTLSDLATIAGGVQHYVINVAETVGSIVDGIVRFVVRKVGDLSSLTDSVDRGAGIVIHTIIDTLTVVDGVGRNIVHKVGDALGSILDTVQAIVAAGVSGGRTFVVQATRAIVFYITKR